MLLYRDISYNISSLGLIMDSTLGIVSLVCYLGGVCDFHNQLQTSITAKTTALGAYANAKANLKASLSGFAGATA